MEYTKRKVTEEELHDLPHLFFNTGCRYTKHGQRLLALKLDDDVLCYDYDRCIEYLFEDCPMKEREIERREKAMGQKKTFFQEGIINWRVWKHWQEKLNIERD